MVEIGQKKERIAENIASGIVVEIKKFMEAIMGKGSGNIGYRGGDSSRGGTIVEEIMEEIVEEIDSLGDHGGDRGGVEWEMWWKK